MYIQVFSTMNCDDEDEYLRHGGSRFKIMQGILLKCIEDPCNFRNPWTSKTAYDSCPSRARFLTSPPTYSSYVAPSRVLAPHTASILQWTNAKSTWGLLSPGDLRGLLFMIQNIISWYIRSYNLNNCIFDWWRNIRSFVLSLQWYVF